jgi:hypothetical protein
MREGPGLTHGVGGLTAFHPSGVSIMKSSEYYTMCDWCEIPHSNMQDSNFSVQQEACGNQVTQYDLMHMHASAWRLMLC